MNASQRQNVINRIDSFKEINIPELFVRQFGEESKPEETSIGDYSLSEFFALTKKMFAQLEERINQPLMWQMLPASQHFQNDFGSCDLNSNCSYLISYINGKQYPEAVSILKSLIYYQIANGFWELPKKMDLGVRAQSLDNLEIRTALIAEQTELKRGNIETLLEEVEALKASLNTLKTEKNAEFAEITQNLTTSQTHLINIQAIENSATASNASIDVLKRNCSTIFTDLETKQAALKVTQDDIKQQQEASEKELKRITEDATAKLTTINTDHQYVEEKKEKVREMMGYIADGTLSHSFNSRKTNIQKSVLWWGIGSIGCGILMGVWIFVVFIYLQATTDNVLANMFINVAKTSPMIVLFWFALTQYQKERNLLEEYAFREAIAVTLTAYLDQLEGETDEHKRSLLINTVERLYTKPKISSEGVGIFSFKSKDLVDLVKEVKDVLVEVKTKK